MTWLDTARRIVERKQYETVDPTTGAPVPEGTAGATILDGTTAALLLRIHDGLNKPANRERFEAMPLLRAVDLAWTMHNRLRQGGRA